MNIFNRIMIWINDKAMGDYITHDRIQQDLLKIEQDNYDETIKHNYPYINNKIDDIMEDGDIMDKIRDDYLELLEKVQKTETPLRGLEFNVVEKYHAIMTKKFHNINLWSY